LFNVVIIALIFTGAGRGCADMGALETTPSGTSSFSVYALSRGKGVPEGARKVLEEARILLKAAQERGEVVRLTDKRIGLEGETRLCAEFVNPESAHSLFSHIPEIGQGVDLLNVKIEPCD
ncbi:MAG: hypothetical protein R3351_09750, partial [Nitrospirales bacterium]|nr:hypothetical protein [Nitrospirales bacterium]